MISNFQYQYTYMPSSSPNKTEVNFRIRSPSTVKRRSLSPYDRHIVKIDPTKFELSPSSSSDKSSYQSSLQDTILNKKSLREYTLQRSKKREKSTQSPPSLLRATKPSRTFQVNGWKDNYYTNLLDWSHNNFICAASNNQLSFYNMTIDDSAQSPLCRRYYLSGSQQTISSIKFLPRNTRIAVAYTRGNLKCYDYFKQKQTLNKKYHKQRIVALQWEGHTIFSGSKDQYLRSFDTRANKQCMIFEKFHTQQICSIKSNGNLLASGGNDNNVCIYDLRKSQKRVSQYQHESAIKALDWMMPNILVSGGGTADRKLKFWQDGPEVFKEIDTGSQVCGLKVSFNNDQIVTCQGYSLNQIIVWSRDGKRQLTIHGHKNRVLYCALSPSGSHLATGAGDQRLNVWRLFRKKSIHQWQLASLR